MKKLLTAIAVMAFGIVANAATAVWNVESIYEYGSSTTLATGYALYFFDSAVVTVDTASSGITSGNLSFLSSGIAAEYMEDGEGAVEGGSYGNGVDVTSYFVVFNAADAASATYAYVSAEDVSTTGMAGQSATFVFDGSPTADAGNWTAVPEPTSGLLLLVGGALLALKRRRA